MNKKIEKKKNDIKEFFCFLNLFFLVGIFTSDSQGYLYVLTINQEIDSKLSLVIIIPDRFRLIKFNKCNLNFIPISDRNEKKWSQLITVQTFIGINVSARHLTDYLKNNFVSIASNTKILYETNQQFMKYSMAKIAMSYNIGDRHEVLFAQYYSSLIYIVGFQYSVALSDNLNEDQAMKIILEFAEMNTFLGNF